MFFFPQINVYKIYKMSSEYSFINELFSIMFTNYKVALNVCPVGCFIDRMIKMRLKIYVCVCVTLTRTTVAHFESNYSSYYSG